MIFFWSVGNFVPRNKLASLNLLSFFSYALKMQCNMASIKLRVCSCKSNPFARLKYFSNPRKNQQELILLQDKSIMLKKKPFERCKLPFSQLKIPSHRRNGVRTHIQYFFRENVNIKIRNNTLNCENNLTKFSYSTIFEQKIREINYHAVN